MNKKYFILITLPRCGGTIFSKIINSFFDTTCFNQAFTNIFLNISKKFNKNIKFKNNIPSAYISTKKQILKFNDFLTKKFYFKKQIQKKNTKVSNLKNFFVHQNFFKLIEFYKKKLNINSKNKILGSKEVFAEYFIDYFINHDIKVIFLTRNPFDYIYSCCYGKKNNIDQDKYHLDFFLLKWKFAMKNTFKKKILLIKFEDLILNRNKEICKIEKYLETKYNKKIKINFNNSSHHSKLSFLDSRVIFYSLKKLKNDEIYYIYKSLKSECMALGYLPKNFKYQNLDHLKKQLTKKF